MTILFVANFDAELELADPDYRASSRMVAGLAARADAFASQLGPQVVALVPGRPLPRASRRGVRAVCWCPTPGALRLLDACAAAVCPVPHLSVLQRTNHRAFASELPPPLPGARFAHTLAELDRHLASLPPASPVLLKRPFGFAGRGRKCLPRADALVGAARVWAEASMHAYGRGLRVEPVVEVLVEVALHGIVFRRGGHRLGTPTVQSIDAAGAWQDTRHALPAELQAGEVEALLATGERVAGALEAAGYFGPFGIDGYRWRDATGAVCFHPLGEINARLTMGWCVGMGSSAARILVEEA